MLIFAGLGNPGPKYARNRHNIGFMAVECIARAHGFAPWRAKFQGEASEGRLGREKVLLLKPGTFMNRSGQALGEAMRFYKLAPGDVTVFHDELDLAPGKCRTKQGGGHAGHNGLRSIHGHIGEAYGRVRLGIGHPGRKDAVPGYVLHDFACADEDWLASLLEGIADGAPHLAEGDTGKFQNAVALRVVPPRAKPGLDKAGRDGAGAKASSSVKATDAAAPKGDGANATGTQATGTQTGEARSPLQKLMDRFR